MNKTLLLIIIDFLFLNLIALTQWEKLEVSRPPAPVGPSVAAAPAEGPSARENDLVAAMKQSLTDEQSARDRLAQQLAETRSSLDQREQSLTRVEEERTHLSTTLAETQQRAAQLRLTVTEVSRDAEMSKQQLEQLKRELEAKNAEAERQQKALTRLEQQQSAAQDKIQGLTVAVKAAEQEKQILRETAETFKQQAAAERREREQVQATTVQLAQGVGQLAERSGELTKELRDNRPLNANVIFNEYLHNRVTTDFTAVRQSFLGPIKREREAHTIFVTDGAKVYALLHLDDTPFSVRENGADWERISAAFLRPPDYRTTISSIEFLSLDPRVVALPVDASQVAALGVKIYQTALDPFKFSEAVLVNGGGAGYGEVAFKLDASESGYVRVDNRLMKRLFGDFSPSRGDLVFSRTGELLGIMVNSDYCAIVNNFLPARTIATGDDLKAEPTGPILDSLVARYRALPLKLQ